MKILHIDYDDLNNPYAAGGQAYTTSELMQRLAKQHDITVVTGNYPGAKNITRKGVRYIRLGIGNKGYTVSMLSHWFLLPFYVAFHQKRYDVILECFTAPFTVSLIPFIVRKPLIALPSFFDSKKLAEKYNLPLDIFLNLFIKKYKKFITLTDDLAQRVKKLNPSALCITVPGGITKDFFLKRPLQGTYALYVGRIDIYNKGLQVLLEAWKMIDKNLIIAGSGKKSEEDTLRALIKTYGLQKRVQFIGRVAGKKKIELYRRSAFIIQPSFYETFGYVALEALASGKLLICFDISGYRWIPKKCSIKIAPFTANKLEKGIQKAFHAKKLQENAEKINRNFAKNFTWDAITQQFQQALEKLV